MGAYARYHDWPMLGIPREGPGDDGDYWSVTYVEEHPEGPQIKLHLERAANKMDAMETRMKRADSRMAEIDKQMRSLQDDMPTHRDEALKDRARETLKALKAERRTVQLQYGQAKAALAGKSSETWFFPLHGDLELLLRFTRGAKQDRAA